MSQIVSWQSGGYAVIKNFIGTEVAISGMMTEEIPCLTFSYEFGITHLYADEIKSASLVAKGCAAPSTPTIKVLFLLDRKGNLLFWGQPDNPYLTRFLGITSAEPDEHRPMLTRIVLPANFKAAAFGVYNDNLVVMSRQGNFLINSNARENAGGITPPPQEFQNGFFPLPAMKRSSKIRRTDPVISIVVGERYIMVLTKHGLVYGRLGRALSHKLKPDDRSLFFGSQHPNKNKNSYIQIRTEPGNSQTVNNWFRVKFFDRPNGEEKAIAELIGRPNSALIRSHSGMIFDTKQIEAPIMPSNASLLTANANMLGYFDGKLNQFLLCCPPDRPQMYPKITLTPAEVCGFSIVQNADATFLALLKQTGNIHARVARTLQWIGREEVARTDEFTPAQSNSLPLPDLTRTKNRVAIWANGDLAVALGTRVFVKASATTPSHAYWHFGNGFQVGGGSTLQYLEVERTAESSTSASKEQAIKIFASEVEGKKSMFMLLASNRLAASGYLATFNLLATTGQTIEDTNQVTLIQLPRVQSSPHYSGQIGIQTLGTYENALIILTNDNCLWLNRAAQERYRLPSDEIQANFAKFPLPKTEIESSSMWRRLSVSVRTPGKGKAHYTEPKIVLGATSFYVLLSDGLVIQYLTNYKVPDTTLHAQGASQFKILQSINSTCQFSLVNIHTRGVALGLGEKNILVDDVQLITRPSGNDEVWCFSKFEGIPMLYAIIGNRIQQSPKLEGATSCAITSDSKVQFITRDNTMHSFEAPTTITERCRLTGMDRKFVHLDAAANGSQFVFIYANGSTIFAGSDRHFFPVFISGEQTGNSYAGLQLMPPMATAVPAAAAAATSPLTDYTFTPPTTEYMETGDLPGAEGGEDEDESDYGDDDLWSECNDD